MWETWVWSLGWEDSLEKGKATHSSILAWRIPWTFTFTFWFYFESLLWRSLEIIECLVVVGLVTQLCPTLCNPKEYSPPGSPVCWILQARILEWIAISFSRDLPDPGVKESHFFFSLWLPLPELPPSTLLSNSHGSEFSPTSLPIYSLGVISPLHH